MFEYVRWCRCVAESAKGKSKQCWSRTFKYSEKKLLNILDLFLVNSKLFKTMHFLTISLLLIRSRHSNSLPQFLPCLKNMGFLEAVL